MAIYTARRFEIAVVLTDMMMPVLDGPATIEQLTGINPSVRIIATSGVHANRELAENSGRTGGFFLQKPYTAETLLTCVAQVLGDGAAIG